jgi:hypothetical protein
MLILLRQPMAAIPVNSVLARLCVEIKTVTVMGPLVKRGSTVFKIPQPQLGRLTVPQLVFVEDSVQAVVAWENGLLFKPVVTSPEQMPAGLVSLNTNPG